MSATRLHDMEHSEELTFPDRAKFGQLVNEHRPRLLAMLSRRIDPNLAVRVSPEEVFNDACLSAQRRWAAFRNDESAPSPFVWLYGIALNCLRDRWRHEAAQRRDLRRDCAWPEQSSVQLAMGLLNQATTPSEAVARRELSARIEQTLGMLKEKDRDILSMRHFDALSFGEISEVLSITENAATVRYVRAVERLRKIWLRVYPDEAD